MHFTMSELFKVLVIREKKSFIHFISQMCEIEGRREGGGAENNTKKRVFILF